MHIVPSSAQAAAGLTPLPVAAQSGPDREAMPIIRQYLRVAMRWRYVIAGTAWW